MPTRKQRRRREKEMRHDYVWEDDEGNVLEPDEVPTRKASDASRRAAAPSRSLREPQPPSWRKTLKRGVVFAPIMLVTVMFLSSDQPLVQQIIQTAFLVGIFIPFSYFIDGMFYRSYKRRIARQEDAPRKG
jgi:hypothetical protein